MESFLFLYCLGIRWNQQNRRCPSFLLLFFENNQQVCGRSCIQSHPPTLAASAGIRASLSFLQIMPPRCAAGSRITHINDVFVRDDVARLTRQIEELIAQVATLAARDDQQRDRSPSLHSMEEEEVEEEFHNPFSRHIQGGRRPMMGNPRDNRETRSRWDARLKIDIPEFQGSVQPEEFLDWIYAVEEVLDFKEVPENK